MKVEPQKEHQWLQKLIGEWVIEAGGKPGPGEPDVKTTGSETVRSIGDVWIVAEGEGEMPGGGRMKSVMTLGYDPQKKRYTGTWLGSMMTHLWVYDGEMDSTGKILTLYAEGPSMSGDGSMAKYKDVIEVKSDDHRTLSSSVLAADGSWNTFMNADYRRSK